MRAGHHLVDVDLFDVVAGDQLDDVVEDLEVLVGVLARGDLAQEPADDRERDDRRRESRERCGGCLRT